MEKATNENVDIVIRQTNYTSEEAVEKLKEFNENVEEVVKDYFGIRPKVNNRIVSYNQEIYKQIREKLKPISTNISITK
jgi:Zn-dependent oligopeptidase